MEQKINIAELLKDCPKGMELDCIMYDDITLLGVDDSKFTIFPIRALRKDGCSIELTKYGQYADADYAKCIIFPKGKTTWEGFVPPCKFKAGDIVYVKTINRHEYILIFKEIKNDHIHKYVCFTYRRFSIDKCPVCQLVDAEIMRLATEEEKANLFDAIKANGYVWNAENKTLKKLAEPKFKKGDIIQDKDGYKVRITNVSIEDECYGYESLTVNGIGGISFNRQDKWELVKNKFDITTLVPFESRVLMRSSNAGEWVATFYSHYSNNKFYGCGMYCDQCIPYEGNQHLLGTTNDCDEFYKNWE